MYLVGYTEGYLPSMPSYPQPRTCRKEQKVSFLSVLSKTVTFEQDLINFKAEPTVKRVGAGRQVQQ